MLCDGYNYTVSSTAQDRNITIPSVLSLLGWRTFNIWSLEWWDTPEQVLNSIIREIERIKTTEVREDNIETDIEEQEDLKIVDNKEVSPVPETITREYNVANLSPQRVDSAKFSQGCYTDIVVNDVRTIIEAEAPISRRLLIKRLINNYGISRNGVRINTYLTEVFEDMGLLTSGVEDIFYWKDKEQLENYFGYRLASEREALDIAPEEVAQAILQVLKEQFAIDEEGLISETARLFGYASVRDNVNASMKRGIEYALKNNMIQLEGGRYKVS
mgnify:CR=1 FL=1